MSTNVLIKKNDGGQASIAPDAVDALRAQLRGVLCLPGDEGYDKARTLWNAMIDRKPALVVRAQGASDVMAAVNFARTNGLLVAVKGGGHNIAGNACCDGGLMIDLSQMKSVRVDPKAKRARVEPGALLSDVDRETGAFGLATPLGINSTTGIAGLTLGGGFGWLSRKHGLTADNLISAEIVTADGSLRQVSQREHTDLFWAIRGGGGNFGVVTSFDFRLHEVGPEVLGGLIVHPFSEARALLDAYQRFVADAADELTCWLVFRQAPPLPFLPASWHGKGVAVVAVMYAGDLAEGEHLLAPLRSFGAPLADTVGPTMFTSFQQAFDPLLTAGARNYWKSHDLAAIGDGTITAIIDGVSHLPTPSCEAILAHLGGAVGRVAPEAMAFSRRDAAFVLNIHARWDHAADDARCIQWAREFHSRVAPHALGSVYVNFMPADESARVAAAYGANFPRLAALKAKWDPGNLFRMNQNIAVESV